MISIPKLLVSFLIVFKLAFVFANDANYVGNKNYLIKKEDDSFKIYDISQNKIKKIKISNEILSFSFLPNSDFLSVIEIDKNKDKFMRIVNVKDGIVYFWGRIYEENVIAENDFPYNIFCKEASLYLVKTENITLFFNSKFKKGTSIQIEGHPVGNIVQLYKIGNYLIYMNEVDEREVYLALDVDKKTNYLLSACGFSRNIDFKQSCLDFNGKKILDVFFDKIQSKKLKKISYNIYESIFKILEK